MHGAWASCISSTRPGHGSFARRRSRAAPWKSKLPPSPSAGLGPSAPNLAKWLGDIRSYFKEDVVTVIQNDAIEKRGLTQLLFEPEMLKNVEPTRNWSARS